MQIKYIATLGKLYTTKKTKIKQSRKYFLNSDKLNISVKIALSIYCDISNLIITYEVNKHIVEFCQMKTILLKFSKNHI